MRLYDTCIAMHLYDRRIAMRLYAGYKKTGYNDDPTNRKYYLVRIDQITG